mmetsp:Transcript_10902/g.20733  ORF Transcript_10902/g.20733 Transcript_10902/m.20733 type:complete len:235 (+) Transcript_10902:27-731(+)
MEGLITNLLNKHLGAFIFLFLLKINAQITLPYRRSGVYLIGDHNSTIQIELFVDLFCDDAQNQYGVWKSLKSEGKISSADVGVKFNVIVEPFHPWSFTAAVGAETARQFGGANAFFSFAELTWANHAEFVSNWNDPNYPLANLTESEVVSMLSAFAGKAGVPKDVFYRGLTNRSTAGVAPWASARQNWKQAVARGAASSPWYFVNAVPFFAASDSADYDADQWMGIIQKLLHEQ